MAGIGVGCVIAAGVVIFGTGILLENSFVNLTIRFMIRGYVACLVLTSVILYCEHKNIFIKKRKLDIELDLCLKEKSKIETEVEELSKNHKKVESNSNVNILSKDKEKESSYKYIYNEVEVSNMRDQIEERVNEVYQQRHSKRRILGKKD